MRSIRNTQISASRLSMWDSWSSSVITVCRPHKYIICGLGACRPYLALLFESHAASVWLAAAASAW